MKFINDVVNLFMAAFTILEDLMIPLGWIVLVVLPLGAMAYGFYLKAKKPKI